jgi:hypothetical protein
MPRSWSFDCRRGNSSSWISCSHWSKSRFLVILRRLPAYTFSGLA